VWLIFADRLPSVRGVIGLRQVDGMPHESGARAMSRGCPAAFPYARPPNK
jgi:hypothetical protein